MVLSKGRLQVFPPPAGKGTDGDIDLTDYFTKTEIYEILRSYLTEEEINTLLDDYYNKEEIDDKLKGKADKSDLEGLMKLSAEKSSSLTSSYGLEAEAVTAALLLLPANAVMCGINTNRTHVGNGDYRFTAQVTYRAILDITSE
ncbi:hypothetical protein [Vibrio hyugaensis]|uniref:hypothetical protein n=1 Tax=Vibrio hyugaensis TaxID=1534743 RepID=UPI0005EF2407|nr:hypothetical protein [Vibrio hyugaensis]